jgi:hypothetical protein
MAQAGDNVPWLAPQSPYLTPEDMRDLVKRALADFAECDMALLHLGVSEMSVAHRLAIYIENRLTGWDVDCEYNRKHDLPKPRGIADNKLRPDIIVHHRDTPRNLLAIEIKKSKHSKYEKNKAIETCRDLASLWKGDLPQYCHTATLIFPVSISEHDDIKKWVVSCHWFHRNGCGRGIGPPVALEHKEDFPLWFVTVKSKLDGTSPII